MRRLTIALLALLLINQLAQAETAALQRDDTGNITQRSTSLGSTTYTYDALNRLTGESGPARTQTFTYDENGNRKSDGAGSYTIDPTSNRMSTRLGLSVSYDEVGNLTADGTGKTYTYTPLGQLYQVFQGGELLATYEYDANGLRLGKTTTASAPQGEQTVVYIHDQWGKLIEEFTGTGTLIRSYIWRDDTPVAQIEHTVSGDKILYFEVDHLNTPRAAMDETGKVVWRWESDAFGSTLPDEDPDKDGNKITINLRFAGQYYDQETALHYNVHRYYDPRTGAYLQADRLDVIRQAVSPLYAQYSEPTDLQRALNQAYGYTGNNPVIEVDPLGLNSWMPNWVKPGKLPKPLREPTGSSKNEKSPYAPSDNPDWTNDPSKDLKKPNCVLRFVWVCKRNSRWSCPKKPDPPLMCPKPAPDPTPGPIVTTPESGCTCIDKELIPMCR